MVPLFEKLRNMVVTDTVTYMKYVMPVSRTMVADASTFFANFIADNPTLDDFKDPDAFEITMDEV